MAIELLYGGTFDPVHAGHLAVARAARDALQAEVAFLPSADPPHRPAPGASAEQRAHLLALAIAGEPGFGLDLRELQRPGPSYTVDTLREWRAERGPEARLAWLIGADAFRGLADWHRWRDLFGLAHFVVAVRPGHDLADLPLALATACQGRWRPAPALADAPAGGLCRLSLPPHPASATELRRRLRAGEPHGGWLAPAVAAHIAREGLYGP
jgi:nicotinate-nucleotide adenylyltransferase